jgi:hypothetical protein
MLVLRQIVVFFLGVGIIMYSVIAHEKNVVYIITGLILVGIIPIEDTLNRLTRRQERQDARQSPTSSPSSPASPGSSRP